MYKKIGFWTLLVIVLVSLNWFKIVRAQSLDNLSDQQKAQLIEKYSRRKNSQKSSNYYKSPQYYGQTNPATLTDSAAVRERDNLSDVDSLADLQEPEAKTTQTLTEFEDLKPFGSDLFDGLRESDPPVDIASSGDYVLGPGDNIILYLWGRVEKEFNLTLDREGKVFIPKVGEVIGWGLNLDQFTAKIKKQLSTVYSEFELTLSLGKIRSIRVFVTGEVKAPGAYSVSSLTSLLNVIYSAGGPNERGTMRNIKLMRSGKEFAEVDLYEFLLKGSNSADTRLRTGDVIFIPVAGPRVAIRGEINREAIYELKGKQTASQLLELAGLSTPAAHLERVMLERIAGKKEWEVIDLNLTPSQAAEANTADQNAVLLDGDRLTIYSIFEARTNMVALFGKVKHPGYYERNDSTKISDLINRGDLQRYDVYRERANLYRRFTNGHMEIISINLEQILAGSDDDLLLQDRDSLHIYDVNEVQWEKLVYIEGEIKNPGPYQLYDNLSVEDLIFLAGSYTRGAYRHTAEIARIDSTGEVTLLTVSLADHSFCDLSLEEDDHVYIRKIPEFNTDRTITLEGEVRYPGKYTLAGENETLYDLLHRAGGFTVNAFPRGVVFKRPSIRKSLDRLGVKSLLDRSVTIVEDSLGNQSEEGMFEYDLSQMNRIIIDLDQIIASKGAQGNVSLQPDDHIYIPAVPTGISIMGAVGANGTLRFASGKNVKDYIKRAGNFTKQADKKGTQLIRADGEVFSSGGTLKQKVVLGDVIVVPTKIEKESTWLKTLTGVLSTTAGILTSVYVVSRI